jgi:hypothetical protein
MERTTTNVCYTIRNYNRCKTVTTLERTTTNVCYTIRNYNRCKTVTTIECLAINLIILTCIIFRKR